MILPADTRPTLEFACNVCGQRNELPTASFHRELAPCSGCGSTPRFRGIVHALSRSLFGRSMPLGGFPTGGSARGIGMSDWDGYAVPLAAKLRYVNTFLHTEPRLDITGSDWEGYRDLDFVICSEVFEHIRLPLEPAFRNLRRMLKTGGCLIFSTPYSNAPVTTEHFPSLDVFQTYDFRGATIIVNRTKHGAWEVHENPVFHGGEGATLERRVFAEADLLHHLRGAGFGGIEIHDQPVPELGYYWPPLHERPGNDHPLLAYIISATAA